MCCNISAFSGPVANVCMLVCDSTVSFCNDTQLGFLSGKWKGEHATAVAAKPFKKGACSLLLCLIHCAGWDASVISSVFQCWMWDKSHLIFFSSRRNHALFAQKYSEFPNKYVIRCSYRVFIRKLCKYSYEKLEVFFLLSEGHWQCVWESKTVSGHRICVCSTSWMS